MVNIHGIIQGEELRKQIGAAAYIECSSKTQQVDYTRSWVDKTLQKYYQFIGV